MNVNQNWIIGILVAVVIGLMAFIFIGNPFSGGPPEAEKTEAEASAEENDTDDEDADSADEAERNSLKGIEGHVGTIAESSVNTEALIRDALDQVKELRKPASERMAEEADHFLKVKEMVDEMAERKEREKEREANREQQEALHEKIEQVQQKHIVSLEQVIGKLDDPGRDEHREEVLNKLGSIDSGIEQLVRTRGSEQSITMSLPKDLQDAIDAAAGDPQAMAKAIAAHLVKQLPKPDESLTEEELKQALEKALRELKPALEKAISRKVTFVVGPPQGMAVTATRVEYSPGYFVETWYTDGRMCYWIERVE